MPPDAVGVSCFVIAPPYRRRGLAAALLDWVIANAGSRRARVGRGYPFRAAENGGVGKLPPP
jgi:GNAT superfamily N-acetyltransferase